MLKSREGEMVGITGFFPYSCLQGDKLYLLVYGLDESRNKPTSHHILVLEITQKDLRPIKIFNLIKDKGKNPWYYSSIIVLSDIFQQRIDIKNRLNDRPDFYPAFPIELNVNHLQRISAKPKYQVYLLSYISFP